MSDIIHILPDAIANQIAAGEVIQRPSSAVKELMENSVDAGSASINLIVKDAGKTLIQVIDNGCGMSETDARMSFERHATSKINNADDLFAIRTMGFRGEALASIASIAQVELKTKRAGDETGTKIILEGSAVISQEACACSEGTSVSVKNLFYNVPARRNFLKSNGSEMRHIIDEFFRIALAHPNISFTLHHNGNEMYHLKADTLRQRIISLFGNSYNQKIVPVEEKTDVININGFIGKPEFAKKTRGEQYFFVNKRFIKNPYLNHALTAAYNQLLPAELTPFYVLNITIEPKEIDINVHPTKTEIKFIDEKTIYAIIRSAVRHSLGKFNISPSLDFEQDKAIISMIDSSKQNTDTISYYQAPVMPAYNPFSKEKIETESSKNFGFPKHQQSSRGWEKLYQDLENRQETAMPDTSLKQPDLNFDEIISAAKNRSSDNEEIIHKEIRNNRYDTYQLHNRYILTQIKSGLMIIDQQAAHERILYEKFLDALKNNNGSSQKELFPQTIELSASDYELVIELLPELKIVGIDINEFGKNNVIVNGMPSEINDCDIKDFLESIIEQYKQNLSLLKLDKHENIARSMARNSSMKSGKQLSHEEMNALIDELFACKMPYISPTGNSTIITLKTDELTNKFKKINI